MSRSFESINYMLRPNKNVERKLICRAFDILKTRFQIRNYKYVGFGSMWFTDFILMHRVVGISDLVSIERERPKRVEFNKPFACIDLKIGDASQHLPETLGDKQSIVWLDYDKGLDAALGGDVELAASEMPSGSMVLVTVNAVADQLRDRQKDGHVLSPIEYLVAVTEMESVRQREKDLTRAGFPQLVADILHSRLTSAVLSYKPDCKFYPIWTFQYKDDATMVTVGGMIANDEDAAALDATGIFQLPSVSREKIFQIELPVLTDKEKRALDRLLPSDGVIDPKSLEFELRPTEIEAYRKFYLDYPIFNELVA